MAFGYPGIRTRTGQGAEGRVGEFPNVAQAAGIITLVAVAILILMHRGFAGISVDIN